MIAIGSDHGGFALKQAVIKHLESRGEQYRDLTAFPLRRPDYIMTRMFLQWEPASSERGWR